jgi:putative nucleotidyltransferase with HDIG domain
MRRQIPDRTPRWRKFLRTGWREGTRRRVLLALVTSGCLFVASWARVLPPRLNLVEGDIAPRTIRAPRAGVYVDEAEMQKLREEAARSVPDVYEADPHAAQDALATVDDLFARVRQVRADPNLRDSLARIRALRAALVINLSPETVELLVAGVPSEAALNRLQDAVEGLVRRGMAREIRNNGDDLKAARQRLDEAARELGLTSPYTRAISEIGQAALKPNMILDEAKTQQARDQKRQGVKDVVHSLQPGDLIIQKGQEVRSHHIAAFRAVGLIQSKVDYSQAAAVVALYTLMVFGLGFFTRRFAQRTYAHFSQLVVVACLLVVGAFAYHILEPTSWFEAGALTMAVTAAMIVALLVNALLALATGVFMGLLLPLVATGSDARQMLITLLCAVFGAYVVSRKGSISSVVATAVPLTALAAGLLAMVSSNAFGLTPAVREVVAAALGGLASPLLATGATLALERLLDIATPFRLMELANPNEPLLRKLLAEAPGTYQSSIMVGNLAEPAAEEIGADAILVRTAAMYHDIGKLRRPYFFVENQFGGENPHDRLSPYLSTLVIVAHVKDGLELAEEYRLPSPIRDCIAQHHGTSLIKVFYQRAMEAADDPHEVDESAFRYPGPKPQTREAAILMLADAIEAAARTLERPSRPEVVQLVERLVEDRIRDGQLDESPLSFRDLAIVKRSFVSTLTGMFHQRIRYPEQIAQDVQNAQRKEEARRRASGKPVPKFPQFTPELAPQEKRERPRIDIEWDDGTWHGEDF